MDEKARQKATDDMVQSWRDRLQLITVLVSFCFAKRCCLQIYSLSGHIFSVDRVRFAGIGDSEAHRYRHELLVSCQRRFGRRADRAHFRWFVTPPLGSNRKLRITCSARQP